MDNVKKYEIDMIGKVTSSFTHDLTNVFASIKELSGLMEDIVSLSSEDENIVNKKLQNIIPKIHKQVSKGGGLVQNLNLFSHMIDDTKNNINLKATFNNILYISNKLYKRKKIDISIQDLNESYNIETIPLFFYSVIFFWMERFIAIGEKRLLIQIEKMSNIYRINIFCNSDSLEIDAKHGNMELIVNWDKSEQLIKYLKGSIEYVESNNSISIQLPHCL